MRNPESGLRAASAERLLVSVDGIEVLITGILEETLEPVEAQTTPAHALSQGPPVQSAVSGPQPAPRHMSLDEYNAAHHIDISSLTAVKTTHLKKQPGYGLAA
ncbi:MAG TPA: hypothetical protein VMS08_05120 [Candidatus Saccharimonadia bacterium]|nr:hypothetical protein [Candidatus Saccharimonadia bacterium]